MQPLVISQSSFAPFKIFFHRPFEFAGNIMTERVGFYLTVTASNGLTAQGEIAPLPGISEETLRRARHDLGEIRSYLAQLEIFIEEGALIAQMRQEPHMRNLCPSVRFGVESVLMALAAKASGKSLCEFLGGTLCGVPTAALLQGNHEQVITDAKRLTAKGCQIFKLKVGDRNIALDVKKVQDLRMVLGKEALIRLDGNRAWSLKEALIFAELTGHDKIEFIEEPLRDPSGLNEFYQQTRLPIALDETLSPALAKQEWVKAFVLKPMILGGIIATLDWIKEARSLGKKAVISSAFESPVGLNVLAHLACLTGQAAGLGTERWFKNVVQK